MSTSILTVGAFLVVGMFVVGVFVYPFTKSTEGLAKRKQDGRQREDAPPDNRD